MGTDLPDISHIDRLELIGEDYTPVGVIRNRDGERLSLQIYYLAFRNFGGIGPKAANSALLRYGDHVEDARRHPGKHPNIDRLFTIIAEDGHLSVHVVSTTEARNAHPDA